VCLLCDPRTQQGEVDLEDKEDQFQPQLGNVAFASAHDGWAFRISQLAKQYADKLGCNAAGLEQALWGDYAFQAKTKRIIKIKPDQTHKHKPLFVQVRNFFLSDNSVVTAASVSDACQAIQMPPGRACAEDHRCIDSLKSSLYVSGSVRLAMPQLLSMTDHSDLHCLLVQLIPAGIPFVKLQELRH